MKAEDRRALVESWLAYQRHWWAFDVLREQVEQRPEDAWVSLLHLVDAADSAELLEDIGAGPLEDFLKTHGSSFVERVEAEAGKNEKFARAMSHVWLRRTQDPTTIRLVSLGCQLVGE